MRYIVAITAVITMLFVGAGEAAAASVDLNNYYYAHANQPGEYTLGDKYGNKVLKGDYNENDAYILQLTFRNWQGRDVSLIMTTDDGQTVTVTQDTSSISLYSYGINTKTLRIKMITKNSVESYVEIAAMNTNDTGAGVNVTYIFTGKPPTKYGDLGPGAPSPSPTTSPTPTPTAAPTPTPAPTPKPNTMTAYYDQFTSRIIWPTEPTNTDFVRVLRDGVQVANIPAGIGYIEIPERPDNVYELQVISKQGNQIAQATLLLNYGNGNPTPEPSPTPGGPGGGDSGGETGGGGGCDDTCQQIIKTLECPEFDEYLGKWADMIRTTYPPPPNWDHVGNVMRDKIVPAMGQELVNRSPEIARIIADEFQSREKAVAPPRPVPSFEPPVPQLNDGPAISGNINTDVPSFTPDYAEDKAFIIPDPSTLDFSDTSDAGYEYQPMETTVPDWSPPPVEPSTADPGYVVKEPAEYKPPIYVGGQWPRATELPKYNVQDGQPEEMPGYELETELYQDYMFVPEKMEYYEVEGE